MMKTTLAIDAGGTSSRAALLDATGRCLGTARAAGGNPTSSGVESAAAQIAHAAALTLANARLAQPTLSIAPESIVAITQAGQLSDLYRATLLERLAPLGFGGIVIESDLLGMFGSGSASTDGIVLVAGTGSVAGRVAGGRVVQEVGGAGWLLGDGGSGFWIARRVLRAVTADLDGLGPRTRLTDLVCDALALPTADGPQVEPSSRRRSSTLEAVIRMANTGPPVSIARFAPFAFAVPQDDVAMQIVDAAVDQLVALVDAVGRVDTDLNQALVVGGSVLVDGILPTMPGALERLAGAAGGAVIVPVADGLLGAAMFGIRALGGDVDDALFARAAHALAPARPGATS